MSVLDVFGELGVPEDAVEKGRNVGQILFCEVAAILRRLSIELILVKLRVGVTRLNTVLGVDCCEVYRVSVFRVLPVLPNPFDLVS